MNVSSSSVFSRILQILCIKLLNMQRNRIKLLLHFIWTRQSEFIKKYLIFRCFFIYLFLYLFKNFFYFYASGSFTTTLNSPEGSDISSILPPIASTSPLTINSPSPVPLVVRVVLSSTLINFPNSLFKTS